MSESLSQKEEIKKSITLKDSDFEPAFENVKNVEAFAMTFAGKSGMNPYVWIYDNLAPLKHRFDSGERSPELLRAMLSLRKTEPVSKNMKPAQQQIKS